MAHHPTTAAVDLSRPALESRTAPVMRPVEGRRMERRRCRRAAIASRAADSVTSPATLVLADEVQHHSIEDLWLLPVRRMTRFRHDDSPRPSNPV